MATCAAVASDRQATVLSATDTTLGAIRHDFPDAALSRWLDLPDTNPARLCYLDGAIPKGAASSASFDRSIVAIVGDDHELLVGGLTDQTLELNSRNLQVTVRNLESRPVAISFTSSTLEGIQQIAPLDTATFLFEPEPRQQHAGPPDPPEAWMLQLGTALYDGAETYIGMGGPFSQVATSRAPLAPTVADILIVVDGGQAVWGTTAP